jgi:hypothetical protein
MDRSAPDDRFHRNLTAAIETVHNEVSDILVALAAAQRRRRHREHTRFVSHQGRRC